MASVIIARGKLVDGGFLGEDPTLWLASGRGQQAVLIDILERLKPYIGKTITISYEEPEEESVGLLETLARPMKKALALESLGGIYTTR